MMKVSKFIRYFFSILSILAVVLGIVYFVLYYSSKEFKSCYENWDVLVMAVTAGSVFITEIANLIFLITKICVQPIPKKLHIKNAAKISIPILLIVAFYALVKGGDAFYIQIALLMVDIVFLIAGDMIDYTEVVDVETTYE